MQSQPENSSTWFCFFPEICLRYKIVLLLDTLLGKAPEIIGADMSDSFLLHNELRNEH
jgi:hypothetical protein